MAEDRIFQKKFGSTGGTTEFGQFGSLAEGAANTTQDLDEIQSLDTFLRGWYGATNSASEPPRIQDMNGLFYLIFSQIRYLLEKGIPEWLNSASQRYYANVSYVSRSGAIYLAILGDDSTNINAQRDPLTETTFWRKIVSVQGAVNLDGAQTVAGIKTFSSIPVLPSSDPTSDNQATRKSYVDDLDTATNALITALDAAVVKLTGNQTVAGTKTFSSIPVLPSSSPTLDNHAARKKYIDDLITTVNSLITALDSAAVKKTSSQTLTGNNEFSGESDFSGEAKFSGDINIVSDLGTTEYIMKKLCVANGDYTSGELYSFFANYLTSQDGNSIGCMGTYINSAGRCFMVNLIIRSSSTLIKITNEDASSTINLTSGSSTVMEIDLKMIFFSGV